LKHNSIKRLLNSEIISIDYVKLERNLVDPITKPVGRNMILETSRETRHESLANKQVIKNQSLWLEIPWIRFIQVKTSHFLVFC